MSDETDTKLRESEQTFSVHYCIPGKLTLMPLYEDVIAYSKQDAERTFKRNNPRAKVISISNDVHR